MMPRLETLTTTNGSAGHVRVAALPLRPPRKRAVSSWQPIETAPKDAKRIELWFPHDQRAEFGHWDSDQYAKKPRPFWSGDLERIFGRTCYRENPPSHWRPMSGPTQETLVAEELRRDRERMCAPETPADLVGALQDRAHVDAGPFRAGQSVKETGGDDVSR